MQKRNFSNSSQLKGLTMATAQASGRHCLIFLLLPKRFVLSTLKNKGEYQKQIIKVIRVRCKSYRSTIKFMLQALGCTLQALGFTLQGLVCISQSLGYKSYNYKNTFSKHCENFYSAVLM